ncbi:MAG TPA: PAS domain-containing protein [Firmicutes bacterium]|nr:PAS domain-containing protein [Bacillota bacterium]
MTILPPRLSWKKDALKIALIFLFTGFLWIFFSDYFLRVLFPAPALYIKGQLFKGLFFVLGTALLLFLLTASHLRKRDLLHQQIRLAEIHYRSLLEILPDPLLVLNGKGHIEYVNSSFKKSLYYNDEDLLGRTVSEICFSDIYKDCLWDYLKGLQEENPPSLLFLTLSAGNGETLYVLSRWCVQRDDLGHLTHVIGVMTDLNLLLRASGEPSSGLR